jgi:ribose transport system ATP-binding protein
MTTTADVASVTNAPDIPARPPSDAPAAEPILEVRGVTKRFPGVLALDDVSLAFYPGEVHAIVGENGAGKSTLMKILAGAYVPEKGEIRFQGRTVSFDHPSEAQEAGISIIYQEFNLLPERTVAQNIFLGREPVRFGTIDNRRLRQMTIDSLHAVDAGSSIDPDTEVKSLSVAEQQMVEIAKALSFEARVLIMDEPTAALSMTEVELLNNLVRKLVDQGMAVLFISHRFKEVFGIARRITVLKDGKLVETVNAADVTPGQVIKMMVGRDLDHYFPPRAAAGDIGDVVLRVTNGSNDKLHGINLELRKGEILGIAGLQGSGRTELARALFGADPFITGTVELPAPGGLAPGSLKSPARAIGARMGFVTEDRKSEGIFANQPISDNILTAVRALQSVLRRVVPLGTRQSPQMALDLARQVDVRAPSMAQEVQYLSGGNQQKVVLAKWLASTCDIFLFDEPTRGIDVEAKASIHDMVRDLAKGGAAVLMISSELPEVIGMSDRIAVMWDGRIVGELPAGATEEEIMLMATGHSEHETPAHEVALHTNAMAPA